MKKRVLLLFMLVICCFWNSISSVSNALADPETTVSTTATLAYTIHLNSNGLETPCDNVVQNFCINNGYIYTTQNFMNANGQKSIYISRLLISGNTATIVDRMTLNNIGHNQALEIFIHNSKVYFWIGCKPHTSLEAKYTMQIARVEYQPGTTISSYTQLYRLSNLNCANKSGTSAGGFIKRVDAGLSSDRQYLLLATRFSNSDGETNQRIQYSCYPASVINNLLDEREAKRETDPTLPRYISFSGNDTLKSKCLMSFEQQGNEMVLPNGSCQGIDVSNSYAYIYVAGGNGKNENNQQERPRIGRMLKRGIDEYIYQTRVEMNNTEFGLTSEIEGVKLKNNDVYFGVNALNGATTTTTQYIYKVPKSIF